MSAQKFYISLVAPVFFFGALSLPCQSAPAPKAKKAEIASAKLPIVYDFYTDYCAPCKVIKPIFDEVEKEYHGKVDMESIDAADPKNKALVEKYAAESFPYLVFVNAKNQTAGKFHGKITKKELVERVQKLLAK